MKSIRMESSYIQFVSLLQIPDMDMLITMAMGSRDILHEEISSIYKENKVTYYREYKNSPYYHDSRLQSLSVQNYQAIQQFIGIYLHEQSLQSTSITMKLIKKGYRFVYNFVKNNLKVDLYKLRDDYIAYVKKNSFEKNVHLAHLFGIALFLCEQMNKDIIYDSFDVSLIKNTIDQVFIEIETKPKGTEEAEKFLEEYRTLGLMKDFSLPLKDLIISLTKFHDQEIPMEHDFYKGLSKVALILQYCNINPLDIQNITNIDQVKMKEIISLCLSGLEMFNLTEHVHSLLGSYLLIYALAADYNVTKHSLIITSQEEAQLEMLNLKKEYEERIRAAQREEEQREAKISQLTESNKRLIDKVQELEKQLLKKEKQLEENSEQITQLKNEQELLIQQIASMKRPCDQELSNEEMAAELNKNACVIVGGLKSWQEQLKEFIPSARFLQPEDLHVDLDFILNANIVFFNESINSHAMFQRIKAKLEHTTIPISFSGNNSNIHLSLKKMYEALISSGGCSNK